jgi:glycosyltransferase involved in cell wall biosynthesis
MSKPKLLCIDLRWIDKSGVGTYIKGIMPGIVDRLGDVVIAGVGNIERLRQFDWARAKNLRLIGCHAKPYSIAEQLQLPLAIPSQTDLFFSPYYTIPLLYRGPLAVTVHDMSHRVVEEITSKPSKSLYAQIMYKAIRKRAAVIFTVSGFSKSELLRLTTGHREDNIIPTHLGISDEWYGAGRLRPVRTGRYFVCVGNIKPYKNLGRLVDAYLKIRHLIPHDLVIIGQSEGLITGESPEFFNKLREAPDRIHLTGFVSDQELRSLVAHAEALIMPSLYEGFGLPPLEAMAAGVPAAVARAASLPEVCGQAACYFDPLQANDIANTLVALATDDSLRQGLIRKGLEWTRLFTWNACSEKTARALRGVLDSC